MITEPSYWCGVRVDSDAVRAEKEPFDAHDSVGVNTRFFGICQPADDQHWGSCVARGTAGVIEDEYRLHGGILGPNEQVDALAIYRYARERYWPEEHWNAGGLLLDQGFLAARELGILPPEATLNEIVGGFEELADILKNHTLIQAHFVTKAWFRASHESGEIPKTHEAVEPWSGRHCTKLCFTQEQNGIEFIGGQNSWGPDYGRYGYFMLEKREWVRLLLPDGPYWIKIPEEVDWKIPPRFIVKA